jgi:hypothetical protein
LPRLDGTFDRQSNVDRASIPATAPIVMMRMSVDANGVNGPSTPAEAAAEPGQRGDRLWDS